MHTFNFEKLSQKMEKYYKLSFDDFLNEVKKKKVNVKSRDNYQTLKEEFEKSIKVINPLLQQIKVTDNEIDQMVYDLYGLTDEEIKIVEGINEYFKNRSINKYDVNNIICSVCGGRTLGFWGVP